MLSLSLRHTTRKDGFPLLVEVLAGLSYPIGCSTSNGQGRHICHSRDKVLGVTHDPLDSGSSSISLTYP